MQITWNKARKSRFLWNFAYKSFSFSVVEILRLLNAAKFCIFKNIVLFVIEFGRELCFLFFHFFIFYANLEFQPPPCQLTKMKFSEICSNFPLSILAISSWFFLLECKSCKILLRSTFFTDFFDTIIQFYLDSYLYFDPRWNKKCWLRRLAVLFGKILFLSEFQRNQYIQLFLIWSNKWKKLQWLKTITWWKVNNAYDFFPYGDSRHYWYGPIIIKF